MARTAPARTSARTLGVRPARVWELARVGRLNAQLHDDDVSALNGHPPPEVRIRQSGLLLDGYRLESADRIGFVDKMVEFAIRTVRAEAETHDVRPETESPSPDGSPVARALAWRARAAARMLDHRDALERTLERRG